MRAAERRFEHKINLDHFKSTLLEYGFVTASNTSSTKLTRMEQLLSKAGSTLVTFAVRSGVQVASTYVIKSVSTLMDHVPEQQKKKLDRKRNQLESKVETVTYSIEVLRLMAAKGNSNLSYVLKLADYLKEDIDNFSKDIEFLTVDLKKRKISSEFLRVVDKTIDDLVEKIDNIIPILNLVLTTYGTSTINNFQDYVSPGRLLNSTVIVNQSNEEFAKHKAKQEINVGPEFSLTFYNIYYNHTAASNGDHQITWREKYARSKFQIIRVPNAEVEYCYKLRILENFDDERYHEEEEKPECKLYDIRQISKLFFSASGRLLKLEDRSSPVLVLKTKKTTSEDLDNETLNGAKAKLHEDGGIEWIAVGDYEVSTNETDSDDDNEEEEEEDEKKSVTEAKQDIETKATDKAKTNTAVGNSSPLSLLEYLIRLCTLQANDQMPLLEVKDERLRLYLADENQMNKTPNRVASLSKKMESLRI